MLLIQMQHQSMLAERLFTDGTLSVKVFSRHGFTRCATVLQDDVIVEVG